jgi:putative membrane protein
MLVANHGDRFIGHHGWWWGLGAVVPFLLLLALIGLVVWAVLRSTSRGSGLFPARGAAAAVTRPDGALEEVRLRYARGEMSREEFLQRSQDLGGVGPTPGQPGPSATA